MAGKFCGNTSQKGRGGIGSFSFSIQFYFPALESTWIVIDGHLTPGITLKLHVQCAHASKFIDGSVRLWTGSEPVQYSG